MIRTLQVDMKQQSVMLLLCPLSLRERERSTSDHRMHHATSVEWSCMHSVYDGPHNLPVEARLIHKVPHNDISVLQ